MENIESAGSVNVNDGQFKRFDRQCQRQHGAQGATRAEGPPACAVKMGLFVVESLLFCIQRRPSTLEFLELFLPVQGASD